MGIDPKLQAVSNAAEISTVAESTSPLDSEVLERVRSLQKAGRPSVLRRLTNLYLESTPEVVEDLRQAVTADAKVTQHKAHRLKGSSIQVGARALSSLCKELEKIGQSGSTEGAESLFSRIETEYERVCEGLRQLLEVEPE